MNNKPPNTIVNDVNRDEMLKFKEQRRFDSWKQKAHFYFDKIWRDAKLLTRDECYKWLSEQLGIKEEFSHIKYLNTEECEEAIYYCQQLLNDNRRMDLDFGANPITPFYILN